MPTETRMLQLGALCDPISMQLAGFLSRDALEQFDNMNNAITTCYVHGLITDGETANARERLLARIKKACANSRKGGAK